MLPVVKVRVEASREGLTERYEINVKIEQNRGYGCVEYGVLAQLVERLNGIEKVRGSTPLGSTIFG